MCIYLSPPFHAARGNGRKLLGIKINDQAKIDLYSFFPSCMCLKVTDAFQANSRWFLLVYNISYYYVMTRNCMEILFMDKRCTNDLRLFDLRRYKNRFNGCFLNTAFNNVYNGKCVRILNPKLNLCRRGYLQQCR